MRRAVSSHNVMLALFLNKKFFNWSLQDFLHLQETLLSSDSRIRFYWSYINKKTYHIHEKKFLILFNSFLALILAQTLEKMGHAKLFKKVWLKWIAEAFRYKTHPKTFSKVQGAKNRSQGKSILMIIIAKLLLSNQLVTFVISIEKILSSFFLSSI